MKKILLIAVLIVQTIASVAQEQVSMPVLTSEDYLEKSKKQKKAARISMATGVGLLGVSLLAAVLIPPTTGEDDESGGTLITGLGVAGIAAGTYLHIASKKNKKKAAAAENKGLATNTSIYLNTERISGLNNGIVKSRSYPALGLRISL